MVYKVTATVNGCEGPPTDYQINVVPNPTTAITFGDPTKRHSTPQIQLRGNIPEIGTGVWTQISGPNTVIIASQTQAETVITQHIPGIYKFKWTITNGDCTSSSELTITVNAPPVALNDYFIGSSKSPISGSLGTNDTDPDAPTSSLVFSKVSDPEKGTLTLNTNGTFTYIAPPNYEGIQNFIYKITDADGGQDTTTVTLRLYLVTTVSIKTNQSKIAEGGQLSISPVLAEAIHEDVTINIRYSGTATGADYVLKGKVPFLIKAGQKTTSQKVIITAIKDDVQEVDETVITEIGEVSSDFVNKGGGANLTITDQFPLTAPTTVKYENSEIKPDPLTSPNGDGLGNEEFFIYNISAFPDNEVVISNRWGSEVFRIKNYNNATNAFRGKANRGNLVNSDGDLQDGVYYYLIYTTGADQIKKTNKGYLILKRRQ
jgi:hypothetical protein